MARFREEEIKRKRKQQKTRYSFAQYATQLPMGFGFLMNKSIGIKRRLLWLSVILIGIRKTVYSGHNILSNIRQYYTYPSSFKPGTNETMNDDIRARLEMLDLQNVSYLPKITVCSNSMHSKERLNKYYPMFSPYISGLYFGDLQPEAKARLSKRESRLPGNKLNMTKFARTTYPPYYISGCIYLSEDCKKNWKMVMTMYGYCLQFKPWKPSRPTTTIGRQYYLSVSLGTNSSDWSSGWKSYMDGFTVFYSSIHEQTLDACYSININNHLVPIISMTRETRFLLGQPYSQCRQHKHSDPPKLVRPKLVQRADKDNVKPVSKYFENYTKRQCYLDCFLMYTEQNCSCRAFYFPKPVNRSDAGSNKDHGSQPVTKASFMIYLVEDGDRYSVEMPEYTVTQLWSDIGGAAGLMLGISFATLIGVVDCLFSFLFVLIRDRQ